MVIYQSVVSSQFNYYSSMSTSLIVTMSEAVVYEDQAICDQGYSEKVDGKTEKRPGETQLEAASASHSLQPKKKKYKKQKKTCQPQLP